MLGHTVSAACWSSLQNSSVREVCSESPSSQSQLDVCFNFPFHLFSTYVRPDFQALAHKKAIKKLSRAGSHSLPLVRIHQSRFGCATSWRILCFEACIFWRVHSFFCGVTLRPENICKPYHLFAQRLAFEIAAGILHRETTHTDPHPYRHRYCEPTPTQTHLQLRLALTNSDFLNDSQDTMR